MQNSKIEWCTHTFNPWHGCVKVSPGCQHCYAEVLDKRFGRAVWGPAKTTPRMGMSENYWKQPARWNEAAMLQPYGSERPRVFCASMADVFEDHPGVLEWRTRLWETIGACDAMDWLLLTKRPENILQMVPPAWAAGYWPAHVWVGTSCEDQQRADVRIPELLKVPAQVRFLSCEPLLGPINLQNLWQATPCYYCGNNDGEAGRCYCGMSTPAEIHWVICGGESGPGARPMAPAWARSLRDQCEEAGVAYFFKQWGQFTPYYEAVDPEAGKLIMSEYPNGTMKSVGKHAAGRLLDGRTWDELPA